MKVLIVKVSSLGDIIHTFPALSDAVAAKKGISFDWVVEEAYRDIPAWHPAVDRVIPVALRRWRKNLFKTWRNGEFAQFKSDLKQTHYDLVIDAQGLIKSGFLSRLARGLTVGMSNSTIKEPLASLFYNVRYTVPLQQHAIERVRDLFSRTFNYSIDHRPVDFGIDVKRFYPKQVDEKYLVFLHGSSWQSKLWPESQWKDLALKAIERGYKIKVVWGNEEEHNRAKRISSVSTENIKVMDGMDLTAIAGLLAGSEMTISIDTGIAHLAGALGVPLVTIFGATNAKLTGAYGDNVHNLSSSIDCSPCLKRYCSLLDSSQSPAVNKSPPCYEQLSSDLVWNYARGILDNSVRPIRPLVNRSFKL